MALTLVSFNYKTTPLSLRERLAVPAARVPELLAQVREACGLQELIVLSTCNRVEFCCVHDGQGDTAGTLLHWLRSRHLGWDDSLADCAVVLHDRDAVTHLFRVACSLESMVLGEPQILGQVKEGYHIAAGERTVGPVLNGLFQQAFHAAKRVRTETDIARFPVSVSYVAAELAGRIFDTLDDKTVMVVGAGEMAELVVTHLQKAGAQRLVITNRTFANAVALAEKFQGSAVRYQNLAGHLADADIVISSTGAQGYVVDQEMARHAERARKGRPIFFIDIAVPRDVDPQVNELSDVYCYDIDDLQAAASANHREREQAAGEAQRIIAEEAEQHARARHADAVVPVVKALRRRFTATGEAELERALQRLAHLPEEDAAAVRGLVRNLVNKLLHTPSSRLKAFGAELEGPVYADALRALFALEEAERTDAAPGRAGSPAPEEAHRPAEDDAPGDGGNVLPLRRPGRN